MRKLLRALLLISTLTVFGSVPAMADVQSISVSVTPTVTASSAYATGNEVGGLMTFANSLGSADYGGVVESASMVCKSAQTAVFKLYLFSANPSTSTWTDKTAPAINAADVVKVTGPYTFPAADSALGTMTTYNLPAIGEQITGVSTSLYGVLVVNGTPTFASASDCTVTVRVLKDQ